MNSKDLWTVGELATYLRVSEKTVYRRIRQIPGAFKLFNGSWRIDICTFMRELSKLSERPTEKAELLLTGDRHLLLER